MDWTLFSSPLLLYWLGFYRFASLLLLLQYILLQCVLAFASHSSEMLGMACTSVVQVVVSSRVAEWCGVAGSARVRCCSSCGTMGLTRATDLPLLEASQPPTSRSWVSNWLSRYNQSCGSGASSLRYLPQWLTCNHLRCTIVCRL
jgi:hypothetical protein